jgi:nucleoside-diphosphate-sugar epimerase
MDISQIRKVFVTGGTGFIGQALIRDLAGQGKDIVLFTRSPNRVPADFCDSIQVKQGDICSISSLRSALRGCDAIIHCAKADDADPEIRAQKDIEGTRNLIDVAIDLGVRRFQHISTISVYGVTRDGVVDETFPRKPTGDHYTKSKIRIEEDLLERQNAIEVVILQPANVYGPGACWWSHAILDLMNRGTVIVVEDGRGLANMIHVADLVQAIRLALLADNINGECFIITDGKPIPWEKYFKGLEQIVGRKATVSLTLNEAKLLSRKLMDRTLAVRAQRWLGRKLLNKPIIFPLADDSIDKFASRTIFSIEKAAERLGYNPRYDILRGLETVKEYELGTL